MLEVGNDPLSKTMQSIQQSYAQHFNKVHEHVGHVFQQRRIAKLRDKNAYLLMLLRYIHQNPVRAGISTPKNASLTLGFAHAEGFGCDLEQFVVGDVFQAPLQAHRARRGQFDAQVGGGAAHVGQPLLLADIDPQVA